MEMSHVGDYNLLLIFEGGGGGRVNVFGSIGTASLPSVCVCVAKKETRHDPAGMSNTAFARRLRLQ